MRHRGRDPAEPDAFFRRVPPVQAEGCHDRGGVLLHRRRRGDGERAAGAPRAVLPLLLRQEAGVRGHGPPRQGEGDGGRAAVLALRRRRRPPAALQGLLQAHRVLRRPLRRHARRRRHPRRLRRPRHRRRHAAAGVPGLPDGCKGAEVLRRAEKGYLSVPHHGEIVLQRWGGSKRITVEEAKARISDILEEYLGSGDRSEALRCIRDLKIPFFHHDVVKRALVLAVERGGAAEGHILDLLKSASEEGVINESQIAKGFDRLIDSVDDLALDVPNARCLLKSVIHKASSDGWLCASGLKPFPPEPKKTSEVADAAVREFKAKAVSIIKEYFMTGDIMEVVSRLEAENGSCCSSFNAIFVQRLINAAMDRKSRDKEMASVLLSALCLPPEDVVAGFQLLIEAAEDAALDNPAIVEDLTMFFARSVVDEVIAPSDLEAMEEDAGRVKADGSTGMLALRNARALLSAKLSAERILRCWGGGGSGKAGWELDEVKDMISKLLQEYDCGGDIREACRRIKDLGMPFFHHEVVKKTLVAIIEKRGKDERLWGLLRECYGRGLITPNQMTKGFERVADGVEDLALDVPDAGKQFGCCVERARKEGWLDASFSVARPGQPVSNGVCS
ncbi:hypothetical protein PVAP13_9KG617800 [Panicum virgatum]|uniref:MI domain-containing protein n=1 Tax=Panicum virgatum TaxID=38727 RepID=A0A8T0NVT9_PANVG|nr:hypothetical protein PVAP13_9KG617800 [Panicum virgatum]